MPLRIKTPHSYFFTDPTRVSQGPPQAFGPVAGSQSTLETKFNLTNLFTKTGTADLKAFAVTDGILFIVPQKDSANLVNIFLKPTNPIDIGLKIKYYVYRSIKIENFFNTATSEVTLLSKDDPKILAFFDKIWDNFLEFNELTTSTNTSFKASELGFSETDLKSYQNFFKEGQYTLPKVQAGEHIGNFDAEFGFEVVIDEGDFSQDRSDTGFEFKNAFFRAKKCVLNLNGDNPDTDYGNIPSTLSKKVFRESIYLFLDPAAYYGSHVTDLKNNNAEGGSIMVKEAAEAKTTTSIYSRIINKFVNKNKTYLYIKSFRGRSYNYYTNNSLPITISNLGTNQNIFTEYLWPFRSLETSFNPLKLRLNIFNKNCLLFCNSGNSDFEFYDKKQLLTEDGTLAKEVSFYLPKSQTEKIASIIYLTYDSGINTFTENLFGPANLNSIFEAADFSSAQKISWISHTRNILNKRGEKNITAYSTKTIIDSTSNVSEKIFKTLIISPVATNTENNEFTELDPNKPMQAGYIKKDLGSSQEFCHAIFGVKNAEIWKGQIKDGSQTINSLALRNDENIDSFPSFVLGFTQKDYEILESRIINILESTNVFISFSSNLASDAASLQFAKYAVQLTYDNKLGEKVTTNTPSSQTEIYLYTIDGLFYFTSLYSLNFKFFSEFAKVTVDFRPRNDWMQYYKYKQITHPDGSVSFNIDGLYNDPNVFYGFDWLKKGDSERSGIYRISDEHYLNSFFLTIGENPSIDPNMGVNVILNKKKYTDVKGLYRVIPLNWKLPNGELFDNSENYTNSEPDASFDKDYAPSWINIPHITDNTIQLIKLRLKLRVNKKPASLKLYFNASNFKVNKIGNVNNPLVKQDEYYIQDKLSYVEIITTDVPINNKIKWLDFEFENINTYEKLEVFKVFADNKLAGLLYLTPNNVGNLRYKKLLTIKIKHNNTSTGTGQITAEEIKMLKIFSSHANIKLQIDEYNGGILDLSTDNIFQQYFDSGLIDRNKIVQNKNIYQYLLDLISGYKDHVKIFSINAGAKSFGLGGFTLEDLKVVIMFNSPMEGVSPNIYHLAHEYLHSVGVAHTFTDKLTDENAFLTLAQQRTNNVMDYNNDTITLHQFVQSTFFWQWAIARQNSSKNF